MVLNSEERKEFLAPYIEMMREARIRNGISQADLAEAVNLSTKYVTFVEGGTRVPSVETLLAMMAHAGVRQSTADELIMELVDLFEWKE